VRPRQANYRPGGSGASLWPAVVPPTFPVDEASANRTAKPGGLVTLTQAESLRHFWSRKFRAVRAVLRE